MKVDDQPIPEAVLRVWKSAVSRLPAPTLQGLAATDASLSQGFRPGKVNHAIAVGRIQQLLDRCAELPVPCRDALRSVTLHASLFSVLSDEAVGATAEHWGNLLGREEVAAGFLLSDSPVKRSAGFRVAAALKTNGLAVDNGADAARGVRDALAPFLEHVRALLPTGEQLQVDPEAQPTAVARAPRSSDERKRVLEVRELRKQVRSMQRDLGAANRNLVAADSARAQAEAEARAATTDRDKVGAELRDLRRLFGERLEEAVRARLDERLLPWLGSSERLSHQAETSPGPGLVEQAEQLLERQAQRDRRFGLRSRLGAERAACESAAERLAQAAMESLSPLPELRSLRDRLLARAAELAKLLDAPTPPKEVSGQALKRLALRFAEATTLEEVGSLRRALQASEMLALLDDGELRDAYEHVRIATSRLFAKSGLESGWTRGRSDLSAVPLYAVQAELAAGRPCTMLVDGHNVLHVCPRLFRGDYEGGQPGSRARKALEERLRVLALRHDRLHIDLWFDGHAMRERAVAGNLRVHFSGGTGADRADHRIVAHLQHLRLAKPDELRVVVTADSDEAAQATTTGALVVVPQELALWLEQGTGQP